MSTLTEVGQLTDSWMEGGRWSTRPGRT
jgi:hypothetical protein